MPRFADEKLNTFHEEFTTHKEMLITHMEAFEQHRLEQQQLHNELLKGIRDNTAVVAKLSTNFIDLATKTENIIEVWTAAQGAGKVVKWILSSIKWTAGTMIAIGGAWYYFKGGPK